MTVEIGFAVVTGALLAGVLFCLVAAPVPLFGLEGAAARGWLTTAGAAAAAGVLGRVVRVLWRFGGAAGGAAEPVRRDRTGPEV